MHILMHNNTQEDYCFNSNMIVLIVTVVCLLFVYSVTIGYNTNSVNSEVDTHGWNIEKVETSGAEKEKNQK